MRQLRHTRILLDIALILTLMVSTGAFVLAFRLAQGPIRLGMLAPYVERVLNPADQPFLVVVGEVVLAWNRQEAAFELHAEDVQVFGADQAVKVRLPELTIGVSLPALLIGSLTPASIGIVGARLSIVRRVNNEFDLGLGIESGGDGLIERLLAELVGQGADRSSALKRITIANASVVVEDQARGAAWLAQGARIDLRRAGDGIVIRADATVEAGGLGGHLAASGSYHPAQGTGQLDLTFTGLAPRLLAMIEPQLGELARIDLPLSGHLALTFGRSFMPVGARLDVRGGAGIVFAREFYADPVAVTGISLRAEVVEDFTRLVVEEARIERGETVVRVAGWASRREGVLAVELDAEATGVALDQLAEIWPVGVARGARAWTTSNIRDGRITRATVHLEGAGPADAPDALAVTEIRGRIEAEDASVHYLRPMRPILGVNAVADFDRERFVIQTQGGAVGALRVDKARIELVNLDQRAGERAKIAVTVSGPTREALALIDERPLGYARAIGLKPASAVGTQVTDVTLDIPLLLNLPLADLTVRADARLSSFAMPDIAFGHAVDRGELRALVDKEHIEFSGGLRLAGAQLDVRYARAFSSKAPVIQTVSAAGPIGPETLAQLGFVIAPMVTLTGPLVAAIEYEERLSGAGFGSVAVDLAPAALAVPSIDWSKPVNKPGKGSFRFETRAGRLTQLPAFTVEAEGLRLKGAATLGDHRGERVLAQLELERLEFGATDLHAKVTRAENGGWAVALGGARLDLGPLLAKAKTGDQGSGLASLPPVEIEISSRAPLAELRISNTAVIRSLFGSAAYDGSRWAPVIFEGKIGKGAIHLQIADAGDGRRLLIEADDAAAAAGLIGITDQLADGDLKIVGTFDDKDPARPLNGRAAIAKLRVVRAPTLAQILTLASLSGIGNTLAGRGIEFDSVVVPFRLTEDALEIKDARVVGSALGISGSGRYDRKAETIALAGELVPAYTLNHLLSRIPLVGQLLAGGGDGLFAATYRVEGPIADPKVAVNPLSVLAPGFARVILEQLGRPTPLDEAPPETRRRED